MPLKIKTNFFLCGRGAKSILKIYIFVYSRFFDVRVDSLSLNVVSISLVVVITTNFLIILMLLLARIFIDYQLQ